MRRRDFIIASLTGGLVWDFGRRYLFAAYSGRRTLDDWAKEIVTMKKHLGMAHIGLGTDGGGRLPKTVEGYRNIHDLPKLVRAMAEEGLSRIEIQAYLGGNLERVVKACLG